MSQQQLLEIGTGFDSYLYNESSPFNFGEFHIENLNLPSQQTGDKIIKLATGMNHVLYLTESGKVYSRGWNAYNQLGVSSLELKKSQNENAIFVKPTFLENYFVKDIACGFNFSYFKAKSLENNDGKYELYSIGWNTGNCCGHLIKSNKIMDNEPNLELVYQFIDPNNDDKSINNLKPFEYANDIEIMDGGGGFAFILVKNNKENDNHSSLRCFVVGDISGIANENVNNTFLRPHKQLNEILNCEKLSQLNLDSEATFVLTDIGNIYLVGDKLNNHHYRFELANNLYKIEGKIPKQIFNLENAIIISTTDNYVFIFETDSVYKLQFQTNIKLICGKGSMAFVITNDHRFYLIYCEQMELNLDTNPLVLSISDDCLKNTVKRIGKIELNLSSVIKDYNDFMNFPNSYELKMSSCNTVSYLLIEKKYNSVFFDNLLNQLQQQNNNSEEEKSNFFDINFNL